MSGEAFNFFYTSEPHNVLDRLGDLEAMIAYCSDTGRPDLAKELEEQLLADLLSEWDTINRLLSRYHDLLKAICWEAAADSYEIDAEWARLKARMG